MRWIGRQVTGCGARAAAATAACVVAIVVAGAVVDTSSASRPAHDSLTLHTSSAVLGATSRSNGIVFSIQIPRWHFFVDELVPVTVTLKNLTTAPITYDHNCPPAGSLAWISGVQSYLSAIGEFGCGTLDETQLNPGHTATMK
jgi:hypothetical protein